MTAVAEIHDGTIVQGSVHPKPVRLLCTTTVPDLTGASVTAIEVYGGTGAARTGWTWAETGTPAAAGDELVGTVTPPAGAQGPATPGEVLTVRLSLTLPGAVAMELPILRWTVESRSGL